MLRNRSPTSDSRRVIWKENTSTMNYDMDNEPAAMENEHIDDKVNVKEDSVANDKEKVPAGCWWKFTHNIRGCWATRHTEDTSDNRELYIKTTIRELVVYILFLIVLMLIAFGMVNETMFDYSNALKNLFLEKKYLDKETTFLTSTTINHVWNFLFGPLLAGLYWERWYNGQNMAHLNDLIYYDNKMLGIPRVRQLRVRSDSCNVYKDFQGEIRHCYAPFAVLFEDKANFGLNVSTAWIYTPRENMNSSGFFSILGEYHDGGYYQDLYRNYSMSLDALDVLFKNTWIDLSTSVIFIDFTLYNPNINLFSVIRLIFEFPATGGIKPLYDFRVVKLLRYVTGFDYFILACEIVFIGFICYYIVEEAIEIKKHGLSYFLEFWNILDLIVIILSILCSVFNIYRTSKVGNLLQDLLLNMDEFPSFDFLSYWQEYFNNAVAINLFIAWIKVFKYISFNKTMTQLSSTLSRCSNDLAGFAVMFFIVFFAFAQLGTLIFGSQINDFRSFYNAALTQFRIILGDFDYQQLESAHRVLGPLYFILFVFFVFFVLINMFVAIITDSYSEVKDELATQKNEFEMADFFKEKAKGLIGRLTKKQQKIKDIQDAIKFADLNHDHQLDFEEWRHELKSRGFADVEIEAEFAKYDKDGDRVLNFKEQDKMQNDLSAERENLEKSINETATSNKVSKEEDDPTKVNRDIEVYISLKQRADRMESNVTTIVTKLDNLLGNFSQIDQMKTDQTVVMMNLLNSLNGNLTEDEQRKQLNSIIHAELDKYISSDNVSDDSQQLKSRPSTGISNRSFLGNR